MFDQCLHFSTNWFLFFMKASPFANCVICVSFLSRSLPSWFNFIIWFEIQNCRTRIMSKILPTHMLASSKEPDTAMKFINLSFFSQQIQLIMLTCHLCDLRILNKKKMHCIVTTPKLSQKSFQIQFSSICRASKLLWTKWMHFLITWIPIQIDYKPPQLEVFWNMWLLPFETFETLRPPPFWWVVHPALCYS